MFCLSCFSHSYAWEVDVDHRFFAYFGIDGDPATMVSNDAACRRHANLLDRRG